MAFDATYYDGQVADPRQVVCHTEDSADTGILAIRDIEFNREVAHWSKQDLVPVSGRSDQLVLASSRGIDGARLVFNGRDNCNQVRKSLSGLGTKRRRHLGKQFQFITTATFALASVIVAYIYGVPIIADRIVTLIPPSSEIKLGDTIVIHMADALASSGGIEACDPDPNSPGNLAITRFIAAAVQDTQTPFTLDVSLVNNSIPNAFALPGGRAFYFAGLLQHTNSADEFAGVLAHEIGHVVHRHGMEQLVATASTGLLVGFVLGDITGLSIAGGLGAALIDSSFSRDAEREADQFAVDVAQNIAFEPTALADLLERISAEDGADAALALLSTHPLSEERRANLTSAIPLPQERLAAFSEMEWEAIQAMCDLTPREKSKS